MQLDIAFDTRPNALNALRLVLASGVLVWHAILFTQDIDASRPVWQPLELFAVDGFFVVSGFLIVRSWDRRPDPVAFLAARLGRLLPGLWLCLVVTAFVIAPLADGGGVGVGVGDQARYVVANAAVFVSHTGLGEWMPTPYGWNISLWSLWWELLCYLAVLLLGALGALRSRVLVVVAALFWAWMVVLTVTGPWLRVSGMLWYTAVPRLGLMFALGALAYLHRDRVQLSGRLAAGAGVVLAVSAFTPNYHLAGAPALGYLVLWAGIELGRVRVLRLRTDLSYGVYVYGAPVLVALLVADVTHRWWLLAPAALCLVLPLAAVSWFLVERPALRWARVISAPGVPSGRLAGRVLRAADPLTRGEAAPIGD